MITSKKCANKFRKTTLSAVLLLPALMLAGCGKKIPDCGDSSVQAILFSLVSTTNSPDLPMISLGANQLLSSVNAGIDPSRPSFELTDQKNMHQNIKFSAFSSIKKNTESGVNYCSAMESGDEVTEMRFTVKKDVQAAMRSMNMDIKGFFKPYIGSSVSFVKGEGSIQLKLSIPNLKSVDATAQDDGLVIRLVRSSPSSVSYTSNLTDKGDQLLVKITERN